MDLVDSRGVKASSETTRMGTTVRTKVKGDNGEMLSKAVTSKDALLLLDK